MKLYLSSFRLGDNPQQLVNLVGKKSAKCAVIVNALDGSSPNARAGILERELTDMMSLGFNAEELDLRKYFKSRDGLERELAQYQVLWISGGNVFILRKAFKQSGLDKLLPEKVNKNELVYAGYSAALYVISPSLKGAEIVDDVNKAAEGYDREVIWEGLNLINHSVAVHYKSDHPESAQIDKEIEYYKKNNIPFKALRDGEVLITNT